MSERYIKRYSGETDQYFSHGLLNDIIFKRGEARLCNNSENFIVFFGITKRWGAAVRAQRDHQVLNLGVTDSFELIIKIHQT